MVYVDIIVRIDDVRAIVAEVMVVVRRPECRRSEELRRRMSSNGGMGWSEFSRGTAEKI